MNIFHGIKKKRKRALIPELVISFGSLFHPVKGPAVPEPGSSRQTELAYAGLGMGHHLGFSPRSFGPSGTWNCLILGTLFIIKSPLSLSCARPKMPQWLSILQDAHYSPFFVQLPGECNGAQTGGWRMQRQERPPCSFLSRYSGMC